MLGSLVRLGIGSIASKLIIPILAVTFLGGTIAVKSCTNSLKRSWAAERELSRMRDVVVHNKEVRGKLQKINESATNAVRGLERERDDLNRQIAEAEPIVVPVDLDCSVCYERRLRE